MMKKLRIYKLVQTIVFFLSGVGVVVSNLVCGDSPAADHLTHLSFWILLLVSFACILIDLNYFSRIDRNSYKLRQTAYVDPLTGVMNHTGMDLLLEQLGKEGALPQLGCIVFRLTNLFETNDREGIPAGDRLVRRFGNLLSGAFNETGYVCRNNAATFLAVFPGCDGEQLKNAEQRFAASVRENNSVPGNPRIEYLFGSALNADVHSKDFSGLASAAYKRASGD